MSNFHRRFLLYFLLITSFVIIPCTIYAENITIYYPPGWKKKTAKAKMIAGVLSQKTGLSIKPRIAKSYPEILKAFSSNRPVLVYVGSFVQTILQARNLSVPIVQGINGKEFYTSVLIAPRTSGRDPVQIVASAKNKITFTRGARA